MSFFLRLLVDGAHSAFRREKAVKDLLFRSAARLDEWMTRGIVGSLKIPIAWVNEAKVKGTKLMTTDNF